MYYITVLKQQNNNKTANCSSPDATCTIAACCCPLVVTVPLRTEPNAPLPTTSPDRCTKFLGICQTRSRRALRAGEGDADEAEDEASALLS